MKIGDQVGGFRVAADCPHCTNGNVFMAVVGSCTVNRALSQNGELRKEAYRKAAAYERKAGDEAHASRNETLSRGEGEGR